MTEKSNVQAVHDTLLEEFRRDDRVVILGEDVGKRGGVFRVTDGFIEEFGPDRVFDAPLAESAIVGVAIGLALAGFRPIAEIQFADFSTPAFDQIVQEAARIRYRSNGQWGVPMVIRMPWGAGVRGALYHSQSLEAFYAHVPGLKVVAPSTPRDITGMLRSAIRDPDPVVFLEHKATYRAVRGEVEDGDFTIPLGPADVKRQGTDITVYAYGLMLHSSLKAAETLAAEGVSATVVDVRSLRPLDAETILREARATGKCLIVYEDNRLFGAGAEIAALIAEEAFEDLDAPVMRYGGPESPATAFNKAQEDWFLPDPERIAAKMRALAAY
ncbi:MAG: 2-oxoisovalerate dehydrogenase [Chloroflexi bacterium RIFCSPLOWO2_02_FULL_71_16]|nr:MAG: 2-oxoisovalerate dehydrogenase [Chloroflexi bacterium RIFCSPLOWO2_02_FULL_71_16]